MSGTAPMPPGAGPPMPPGMQPGAGGLLSPSSQSYPPPLPQIPGLIPGGGMRPTGLEMGSEHVLAMLMKAPTRVPPDSDEGLPPSLHPYAAGLRPSTRPTGAAWQQEIIYEKLGKTDSEIEGTARYYFKIAQNYDTYLSRERITASQVPTPASRSATRRQAAPRLS